MTKTLVRIGAGLVGLLLLLIVGVAAFITISAATDPTTDAVANMTFTGPDGTAINGYIATPEGDGPYPAVLMVHEWWGLNAEITELADRMAEEGYVVLAPDTFRGRVTNAVPRAIYMQATLDENRVTQDMQAAYDYLTGLENVDGERIGVVGFCYGGGVAMDVGVAVAGVDAVVNAYGDTPTQGFGALTGGETPVFGVFGDQDAMIPLGEVRAYEQALREAGVPTTITVYEGVGHAFIQPDAIEEGGTAAQAWQDILAFFDTHL
jgi:carboxymethylenebutenolidase